MSSLDQEATIRWLDNPPAGTPRMTVGSDTLTPALPLSVDRRATHPLAASPGELLAGVIGAAFAYLHAEELMRQGTQARELTASVTLTMSDAPGGGAGDLVLTGIACRVLARVSGIDQEQLEAAAKAAMRRCIEALAMRPERIAVTVTALLESA
jgi:organic hydroperoxide reductase OsmC/OhrA